MGEAQLTILRIALGQMDVVLGNPTANLEKAAAMAEAAAASGAELLVLPELWSTGYDLENAGRHASPIGEAIFAETAAMARLRRLAILGSCLSRQGVGRFANTAVLFGPEGQVMAEYNKMHLFRLMDEERYLVPGGRPCLVETPWGTAGLAICYDLRFPELFRLYALQGAQIVFLPSEWPRPRLAHWQTLLRARAIENQYFVVGCNRVGSAKGNDFFGHSTVVDPWGETVVEGGEAETVLVAELDLALVEQVRRKIPIFADRRPELYG
jgi:predicted amidohydrolase